MNVYRVGYTDTFVVACPRIMCAFDGVRNTGSMNEYGYTNTASKAIHDGNENQQACMNKKYTPNYVLNKLKLNIESMFEGDRKFHESK